MTAKPTIPSSSSATSSPPWMAGGSIAGTSVSADPHASCPEARKISAMAAASSAVAGRMFTVTGIQG